MTRSELITALAARFPQLTSQDAAMASSEIIEAISSALCNGQRIEIRGFGSFALKQRAPARVKVVVASVIQLPADYCCLPNAL